VHGIALGLYSLLLDLKLLNNKIYRVSQEKSAKLREGVPYVKLYRYNPKHLCLKLNGYGGERPEKSVVFLRFHVLYLVRVT